MTASFLGLVQFVTFHEKFGLSPLMILSKMFVIRGPETPREGGGGYCHSYIGMCRCEGYGFQAVSSRIGYINQSLESGIWYLGLSSPLRQLKCNDSILYGIIFKKILSV